MTAASRLPGRHRRHAARRGSAARPPATAGRFSSSTCMPQTPDGRVQLFPVSLSPGRRPLRLRSPTRPPPQYPLSLISPASEHTISSTLGELRPASPVCRMHPDDAHARRLPRANPCGVFNDLGDVQCEVTVTPEIRPGTVSLPKGLWARSTYNGSTANALVPDTLDRHRRRARASTTRACRWNCGRGTEGRHGAARHRTSAWAARRSRTSTQNPSPDPICHWRPRSTRSNG